MQGYSVAKAILFSVYADNMAFLTAYLVTGLPKETTFWYFEKTCWEYCLNIANKKNIL